MSIGKVRKRVWGESANGKPPPAADPPGWAGPPKPLPTLSPVPSFPVELFPRAAADYWTAAAAALGVPVDYVAVPGLAALGAASGRSRAAAFKPGYAEYPSLWAAVVAPPGSTKSAALGRASAPLWHHEGKWRDEYNQRMAEYEAEAERHRADKKAWDKNPQGEPPAPPRKPTLRQAALDQFTGEALARALNDNPRGLLVLKDELTALVAGGNQYRNGKGADFQNLMSCWACQPFKVNRVKDGDAPPLLVPHPFLGVAGMVCPSKLAMVRCDLQTGESAGDGWADRFLWCYPDPLPDEGETWATVPDEVEQRYADLVASLLAVDLIVEPHGAGVRHRPYIVPFDEPARGVWDAFAKEIGTLKDQLDRDDPYRGVLSKLRGYGLRLACALWCIRRAAGEVERDTPVEAEVMRAAATLVGYFDSHGRRCYGRHVSDRPGRVLRRLVRWLERHPAITAFTRTEAFRFLDDTRDVTRGDHLNEPLKLAVDYGYVRDVPDGRTGRPGPAAQTFAVNPMWDRSPAGGGG